MSNTLPRGWTVALVDEITSDVRSGFASGKKNVQGGISQLRMNNIGVGGELVLDVVRSVPPDLAKPNYSLDPGDVLVCTTNSTKLVGKCAFFDLSERYVFSNHLTRLRPVSQLVDGKFLRWNLWVLWKSGYFDEKCKNWVNQSTLPKEDLLNTSVLIPPLPEQRRIVAKLEKLLDKAHSCQKRLAKIPILLKRLRQAVLEAACSGRLTEDWRDGKVGCDPSKELPEIVDGAFINADLPELPENWTWKMLGEINEKGRPIIYGIIKPGPNDPSGVPYVRVLEMKDGKIAPLSELRRAAPERAAKFARAQLKAGDILISKDGTIGRVAIVPPELEGGNITQHLVRVSVHPFFSRRYIAYALRSPHSQNWLKAETKGVALQGVNVEDFRRLPVPIPLPSEQREIVRRVDELFALADQVETRYAKAKQYVDSLKQSILAKAFCGELVPQDPNDEPASILVERIREARGTKPMNRPTRRRERRRRPPLSP
jgi:type I restriction enzyme S subunit